MFSLPHKIINKLNKIYLFIFKIQKLKYIKILITNKFQFNVKIKKLKTYLIFSFTEQALSVKNPTKSWVLSYQF